MIVNALELSIGEDSPCVLQQIVIPVLSHHLHVGILFFGSTGKRIGLVKVCLGDSAIPLMVEGYQRLLHYVSIIDLLFSASVSGRDNH